MKEEKHHARDIARKEFEVWDHEDLAQQMLHREGGAEQRIYGGEMSSAPHELQLVDAWRPSSDGTWQLGKGVIHRVHHEDRTVTVQFLPDQHRCRLPLESVKPNLDLTPTYPAIRLRPGERLPTRAELEVREHNAQLKREELGIPPHEPLPGEENQAALLPGEHLNQAGAPVVYSDEWGMPSTTLAALRDRSIPFAEIKGYYQDHFYSHLYKNNFYAGAGAAGGTAGHVGHSGGGGGSLGGGGVGGPGGVAGLGPDAGGPGGFSGPGRHRQRPNGPVTKVVSHRYIPLQGPPLDQNFSTGQWMPAPKDEKPFIDMPGLLG